MQQTWMFSLVIQLRVCQDSCHSHGSSPHMHCCGKAAACDRALIKCFGNELTFREQFAEGSKLFELRICLLSRESVRHTSIGVPCQSSTVQAGSSGHHLLCVLLCGRYSVQRCSSLCPCTHIVLSHLKLLLLGTGSRLHALHSDSSPPTLMSEAGAHAT